MCECIITYFEKIVHSAAQQVCSVGVDDVVVDFPTERGRGHIYTNAAMKLAKHMKKNPMEVGEAISRLLEKDPAIAAVEVVPPGFINLVLDSDFVYTSLIRILSRKDKFGHSSLGDNEKINIEYVSANPTGPLHVANARGAVLGDVLANSFSALGYDVCREYYVNDKGGQVKVLSESLFEAYKKALGKSYKVEKGMYNYPYLFALGEEIAAKDGDKWLNSREDAALQAMEEFGVSCILNRIKEDLAALGVHHDVFSSEKDVSSSERIKKVVAFLRGQGFVYEGYIPLPKAKGKDIKTKGRGPRKQLLFRSSEFGDSQDRSMQKENGDWTYFAADVSYHMDKIERGFLNQIVLLGADHGSYLKRMEGAVKAMSGDKANLRCLVYQLVNLVKGGDRVSMSKRGGNFVPLRELLEQIEAAAIRLVMLTRHHNMNLDFDCEKAIQETKDNPYYYLQYAYVRTLSILEKDRFGPDKVTKNQLKSLKDERYMCLMVKLLGWPTCIRQTVQALDPHKICSYLLEVSAIFHGIWSLGNQNSSFRFIQGEKDLGKLTLVQAVAHVLKSGMDILGIKPLRRL